MIASRPFTIPPEGKMTSIIATVLTPGTLAFVILAAVVAVAYLINLTLAALGEVCTQIAPLYSTADSTVKLLILCIVGYVLVKLFASLKRSLAASYRK